MTNFTLKQIRLREEPLLFWSSDQTTIGIIRRASQCSSIYTFLYKEHSQPIIGQESNVEIYSYLL